ncbi:Uncharacterised protein [Kluyvera cryocrescens]|uniref:Uncharacterized protein n=1 Tax=Kluyvera cryocrescens TaxID=580 RepID=A0A485B5L0_KLUCR|nr:Uncharacterised protein [Kluyvera cryocrescens]
MASTNTSAISVVVWRWRATWLSHRNSTSARATPDDYDDIPTLFSSLVTKVPDAQVLAISTTSPVGLRVTAATLTVCR